MQSSYVLGTLYISADGAYVGAKLRRIGVYSSDIGHAISGRSIRKMKMTDFEGIEPPLGVALAKRGYSELTPVQKAVLGPELADADALVSAQTGSGKTVAFGLAIAPTLLEASGAVTGAAADRMERVETLFGLGGETVPFEAHETARARKTH